MLAKLLKTTATLSLNIFKHSLRCNITLHKMTILYINWTTEY